MDKLMASKHMEYYEWLLVTSDISAKPEINPVRKISSEKWLAQATQAETH